MVGLTKIRQLLKFCSILTKTNIERARKDCIVQGELSRDIMQYVNHSTRGRARGHEICGCYTTKQKPKQLSKTPRKSCLRKLDKQAAKNQRGKTLKVFLSTWRSYTFCFSITSWPLFFFRLNCSLQGKGNHLWNRACYFLAQSVNPKQANRQLYRSISPLAES